MTNPEPLTIIIQNNRPPQFIGNWTLGMAREALIATLRWLDGIPLNMPDNEESKDQGTDHLHDTKHLPDR